MNLLNRCFGSVLPCHRAADWRACSIIRRTSFIDVAGFMNAARRCLLPSTTAVDRWKLPSAIIASRTAIWISSHPAIRKQRMLACGSAGHAKSERPEM